MHHHLLLLKPSCGNVHDNVTNYHKYKTEITKQLHSVTGSPEEGRDGVSTHGTEDSLLTTEECTCSTESAGMETMGADNADFAGSLFFLSELHLLGSGGSPALAGSTGGGGRAIKGALGKGCLGTTGEKNLCVSGGLPPDSKEETADRTEGIFGGTDLGTGRGMLSNGTDICGGFMFITGACTCCVCVLFIGAGSLPRSANTGAMLSHIKHRAQRGMNI